MDPVRNPFVPGAGSPPPEMAGRNEIISDARIAIQRALAGRSNKSQILLGLRGTGKTVLLNRIEQLAEENNHLTSFIEAQDRGDFLSLLYPQVYQALRKLSGIEEAKKYAYDAMRALKSFVGVFKISVGDVTLSVDPDMGTADSGNIESDLGDLFIRIGQAAQAAGSGWSLLVDEMQYLPKKHLAALIMAIHRTNQKQLPVMFFGAGLPQIAALSGNAKSYAERLFSFPSVGALNQEAARLAIRLPIENEKESISDDALDEIIKRTEGYPFFLQEWGYQAWNIATASPITVDNVKQASDVALHRLDQDFFRVRFDRLTPKEREYVKAMAKLGKGPYRSSDVAAQLKEDVQALGPCRAKIIAKGMIYSQSYGDIAFTVPMFEDYLTRLQEKGKI